MIYNNLYHLMLNKSFRLINSSKKWFEISHLGQPDSLNTRTSISFIIYFILW